jgi:secernin
VLGELINQYNPDESPESAPRYSFFICDTKEAFVIDIVGRLYAAERISEGSRAFGKSFAVGTKIDKQSEGLEEKLKELGLFSGGELDFSKAVKAEVVGKQFPAAPESGFSAQKMFEVLRASAEGSEPISSSFVSVLRDNLSLFWFTGTPDPRESVFKPFIFTSDARISPLTKLNDDGDETNLRKLHGNRKWDQIGELLQSLEKSCVDEVDGYIDNAPLDELHDLMKDCCEAEVKFYR